jgi:hypothetical protein
LGIVLSDGRIVMLAAVQFYRYSIHSITHIFGRSGIERGVGSNSSGQFFSFLRVLKSPELGIVFELTSILSRGIGQFIRTTLKAVV